MKNPIEFTLPPILLILSLFITTGCDISGPVMVNGARIYRLPTPCDSVVMSGGQFGRAMWISLAFHSDQFEVYPEEWKYQINVDESLLETELAHNFVFQNPKGNEIEEAGFKPAVGVWYAAQINFNVPVVALRGSITILPNSAIRCQGESLIKDTIFLKL